MHRSLLLEADKTVSYNVFRSFTILILSGNMILRSVIVFYCHVRATYYDGI